MAKSKKKNKSKEVKAKFFYSVSLNTEEQIRYYIQNQQARWGDIDDKKESI